MTATHFDPFLAGQTLTLAEFNARLEANLARILASQPPPSSYDGSGECDDETRLRLSRSARLRQRSGRYFPAVDADGLDAEGWAVGAEYPRRWEA